MYFYVLDLHVDPSQRQEPMKWRVECEASDTIINL